MIQIFDCAAIIGWHLLSHDVQVTLSMSHLRQSDNDLYWPHSESIINPQRESARVN